MRSIRVSIVGASGYTGGELLRLLLFHPHIELHQVTSERFFGKYVHKVHPNLRKISMLKFSSIDELENCDLLLLCLPHRQAMQKIKMFMEKAEKIIDLSADFRLNSADIYKKWYKDEHPHPEYLKKFIYGIPEIHRESMRGTNLISSAGCNATVTILGLYPLFKHKFAEANRTVVEVKVGSSEGGNMVNEASHHPVRSGSVRSFAPINHRHSAEIEQELGFTKADHLHFSVTSIEMVRGALATCHVFLNERLDEKDIWKLYRQEYQEEPFIRIVKEKEGNYRFPEPKLLSGTNFCDIGFALDPDTNRLVVISAIDNLMKGAAGQAVQALNLMYGFDENTALQFPGLHPI
jgi:N-acetyl-gamma-glutamyl-phosphate/LysW-gamma-L-alpha-aminoadipyl-6-phosphate reductase